MAPANTGKDSNKRMAVINTDQANKGTRSIVMPGARIFKTVEIKLIAPRIEDAPAKCKEKIAISTELPLCPALPAKGG
jgi:hypothetical protein